MTVTQVCRHRSSALGGNSAWSLHVGSPWILSIRACLRDCCAKLVQLSWGCFNEIEIELRWDLGTDHLCGENSPSSVEVSRVTIPSLWCTVSMLMDKQHQTDGCSFTNSHLVMGPSKRSTISKNDCHSTVPDSWNWNKYPRSSTTDHQIPPEALASQPH